MNPDSHIAGSVPAFEQRRLEVLSPVGELLSIIHVILLFCYFVIIGVIITLLCIG